MKIVKIEKKYDKDIEKIIRDCLIEYSLNIEGTAWTDPYLDKFSVFYGERDKRDYFVILHDEKVVGGCGYGELEGDICELQKMYIAKEYRSMGFANKVLLKVEEEAKKHYKKIYLETGSGMVEAIKFYKKHGYEEIDYSLGQTGHNSCGVKMIKDL